MIHNLREARACMTANPVTKMTGRKRWILREAANGGIDMKTYALREALGSDIFDAITLDAAHNHLIAGYGQVPDDWRSIARVVTTSDFKTMNASSLAGLPVLPLVLPNQPYGQLLQSDQKVSYPVQKRGGLLQISYEARANDALGAFNVDSERLGATAKSTLNEFVLGTLFDDAPPCDYDSVALFHSTHANTLSTDGVNVENIQALIAKIMLQTGRGGEQIYLTPTTIIVPPALSMDAKTLIASSTVQPLAFPVGTGSTTPVTWRGGTSNPLNGMISNVIVSPHINADATAYYLICGPANPMVEIAFLNGMTEPEIFREPEGTGSSFTNDSITWKVRHSYGGDAIDHRPGARGGV